MTRNGKLDTGYVQQIWSRRFPQAGFRTYIYIYKYIHIHIYVYRLIKGLQGYRVVSEVFGGEGLGSLRCRAYRVIGLFQRF